ncbi:ATP-binding protein (plasmid) [Polymorphobacter sp. PAMC 29334]|uniref:ATP-binding protein n=1 Tax=Polymorphobacter sp. PAMC 29334 TaxID=2862331 RepID=UPI001C671E47|nr:ATP-binding protein [Polymorphobacter sp. PAMC 29334]QYE33162.1 ATP-binding protein [Polymorphobacter sp. PAMC 29334]
MDPRRNPFSPGAGSRPPELAGREDVLESVAVALDRIKSGRHAQSMILLGLRGVGKTVLLNAMRRAAEGEGILSVPIEAPEGQSLPAMLVPALRTAMLKLDRGQAAMTLAKRGLGALARFVKAFKLSYGELEASLDLGEIGVADNGDLEADLIDLIDLAGAAAGERQTALVLFIDELQYVPERDLAALITALHRARQNDRPITLVAAGLPQLAGQMGKAKSYAERLFLFTSIGPLGDAAATSAIVHPIEAEECAIEPDAVAKILAVTEGYPYFLQEWGKQCWDAADACPITAADVDLAHPTAIAALDDSFFRVRFDRLTPSEKRYLRGMAELGEGPFNSTAIADHIGRKPSSFGPVRASLIAKGMIYTPGYGETAFTVPMFGAFMRRAMPVGDPGAGQGE